MQDLVKLIRKDPNYQKFLKIVENIRTKIDLDATLNEALSLHASRTSRNLHGEDRYSPKTLIDANLKDLSYRARLVELRVKLDISLVTLEEALDAMKRHISTEYYEDLKDFSTADQRKAFVIRVVKNSNQFLQDGKGLIETLDHLIKDIDSASHCMRHVLQALELASGAKGNSVI